MMLTDERVSNEAILNRIDKVTLSFHKGRGLVKSVKEDRWIVEK